MQYVWQYRLWPLADMVTVDGERVDVVDVGMLNKDSGPDFFNAKIKIGNVMWSGNVEIHVRASDWKRHGHDQDAAYDSVVLHVVQVSDARIHSRDGRLIPQLVMACAPDFAIKYREMVNDVTRELPCAREVLSLPDILLTSWFTSLGYERIQSKAERIHALLKAGNGDWAEAVYITLARALGFGTNAEPFELLARSTPLKVLMKHSDELSYIEAILFGQAGLIPEQAGNDFYVENLRSTYAFLAQKYGLKPNPGIAWKTGRMRPQNSPYRRIAILAEIVYQGLYFSSKFIDANSEKELRALFNFNLMGYWARRYTFGAPNAASPHALSHASVTILIVNTVAPIIFAFGEQTANEKLQEKAVALLESLAPERNSVVDVFTRAGIKAPDSAFFSQAFIQLKREYCEPRKCLFCRIGHKLLSQKVKR